MQPRDQSSDISFRECKKISVFLLFFFPFFLHLYFLYFSLTVLLLFIFISLSTERCFRRDSVFALTLSEFHDLFFETESRRDRHKERDRETYRKRTALIETSHSSGEFEVRAKWQNVLAGAHKNKTTIVSNVYSAISRRTDARTGRVDMYNISRREFVMQCGPKTWRAVFFNADCQRSVILSLTSYLFRSATDELWR